MIIDPRVDSYLASLCAAPDPELAAMETVAERRHFPSIDRRTGVLLGLLVRSMGARRILELGSGFGYSALWMARELPEDGKITCIDRSAANRDLALGYFHAAGLEKHVEFIVGDALEAARGLAPGFDLVFNDIDKEGYPESADMVVPLLRPGGLFVTDNTLWKGRVADPSATDPQTEAVRAFNRKVCGHPRFESIILPVGDGVTICRKR
jgi:caffeoyl-CoA O-methyltransferase